MKKCLMCALCVVMGGMVAQAQKVIIEGDGSSLDAQMELYSRWTTSETLKAKYASYADPEAWSSFSPAQFKEIYNKQLKEMYRIVDGEMIQIKSWQIRAPLVGGIAPLPRLDFIKGAMEKVPQLYRVQIKRDLGQGIYLTHVSTDKFTGATAIVQFDVGAGPYTKGTVLEAYLLQTALPEPLKALTRHEIYSYTYKCVSDELGASVHTPTMKEMATAIKKGLKPLILAPTGELPCEVCEGSGVDEEKMAAAEAAAKREAQSLGRREKLYDDLTGKRIATRHRILGESKAFTVAKMKRNKPKCQSCGGDGKVPYEVFRTLVK